MFMFDLKLDGLVMKIQQSAKTKAKVCSLLSILR